MVLAIMEELVKEGVTALPIGRRSVLIRRRSWNFLQELGLPPSRSEAKYPRRCGAVCALGDEICSCHQ